MPFTVEQFLQVFSDYNLEIWPAQIVLLAAGIVIALLLIFRTRTSARLAMALLAALWIWCVVVYHWMHFSRINPAAGLFGALFVAGACFLFRLGSSIEIDENQPLRLAVGGAFVVYALRLSGRGLSDGTRLPRAADVRRTVSAGDLHPGDSDCGKASRTRFGRSRPAAMGHDRQLGCAEARDGRGFRAYIRRRRPAGGRDGGTRSASSPHPGVGVRMGS
jgi:Family of unknown function (DUF6064)